MEPDHSVPASTTLLSATPLGFPSSERAWGFLCLPQTPTFLLGLVGFPYRVPPVRQKLRGLPLWVP